MGWAKESEGCQVTQTIAPKINIYIYVKVKYNVMISIQNVEKKRDPPSCKNENRYNHTCKKKYCLYPYWFT